MTESQGEKAKTRRTEITVRTQLPTQLQNELVGSERMLSFLNRTLEYIEETLILLMKTAIGIEIILTS